jgi:SulP family sulfate permease
MRLTKRLLLNARKWHLLVPIVPVLKNYTRKDLSRDAIAGLVVGMVTVPQAVAYAYLAGLPPEAGLYACLLPMLIYAVMGSSKHLVVGPVAVAALLVAAAIAEHAPNYGDAHLLISSVLCLQVGLILFGLRAFRMGGLVNLLSHPVITGFVNAAALLIIISQLPAILGINMDQSGSPLLQLGGLLDHRDQVHSTTLTLGLCTLVFLLFSRSIIGALLAAVGRGDADHPLAKTGPLWAALAGVIAVWGLELGSQLDTVGLVPSGLPTLDWPLANLSLWLDLLPSAAVIAVISYIESYSIGATLAAKERYQIRPNQELIALGAANIGAGMTGAYPVAGSFSRSGVNYAAGASTPISSVICALIIIVTLLFFTSAFVNLPNAALASIVMVSVLNLVDLQSWRRNWAVYRQDCWTEWGTALGVLALGVEVGLLFGVMLSIAFFLRSSSQPVITQIGRLGDSQQFRSAKRYPVTLHPHVLALRVDENMFFANASQIEDRVIGRALRRRGTTHVLLACGSVNLIDSTGLAMLQRMSRTLSDAGITLSLSELKGPVAQQLSPADLESTISGGVYFSNDEAMLELAERDAAKPDVDLS